VQRQFFLTSPAIMLVGLLQLGLSDIAISIAYTSVPDGESTSAGIRASNSLASCHHYDYDGHCI
jgi:hypothetical protein